MDARLWYTFICYPTNVLDFYKHICSQKCIDFYHVPVQIQVPLSMIGKTCGMCGRYDAEYEQEYKMPSGYEAKNAVSFAQSWILPSESCAKG